MPVPADLETNIGEMVAIVRHVADVTAAMGDGLRAGQFIICGSLTAPMFLETGERGIEFALRPMGAVSVRFSLISRSNDGPSRLGDANSPAGI